LKKKKQPRRAKWKIISSEVEKEIIDAYNSGERRNKIMRKYKIPASQFYKILREAIRNYSSDRRR